MRTTLYLLLVFRPQPVDDLCAAQYALNRSDDAPISVGDRVPLPEVDVLAPRFASFVHIDMLTERQQVDLGTVEHEHGIAPLVAALRKAGWVEISRQPVPNVTAKY
jgi:hypothetical protein